MIPNVKELRWNSIVIYYTSLTPQRAFLCTTQYLKHFPSTIANIVITEVMVVILGQFLATSEISVRQSQWYKERCCKYGQLAHSICIVESVNEVESTRIHLSIKQCSAKASKSTSDIGPSHCSFMSCGQMRDNGFWYTVVDNTEKHFR